MSVSSQGTTFRFGGTAYTVTSVSVSYGNQSLETQRQRVSAAYLGSSPDLPEPFLEIWQPDAMGAGRISSGGGSGSLANTSHLVQVEFIGTSPPQYATTGVLQILGPINLTFNAATCQGSSVQAAVGDVVRGSASFLVQ